MSLVEQIDHEIARLRVRLATLDEMRPLALKLNGLALPGRDGPLPASRPENARPRRTKLELDAVLLELLRRQGPLSPAQIRQIGDIVKPDPVIARLVYARKIKRLKGEGHGNRKVVYALIDHPEGSSAENSKVGAAAPGTLAGRIVAVLQSESMDIPSLALKLDEDEEVVKAEAEKLLIEGEIERGDGNVFRRVG